MDRYSILLKKRPLKKKPLKKKPLTKTQKKGDMTWEEFSKINVNGTQAEWIHSFNALFGDD
jgi:hypothetical protein